MDFNQVLQECRFYLSECENLINDYAAEHNLSLQRLDLLEDKNRDLMLLFYDCGHLREKVEMMEQVYQTGV